MATCKLTGTQRYKRTQIESPAGFHKMKVFKQCCLSKVKMFGSWRLLALGLTADLCTELSFNAPLTSVVTRLSSFSRLSQRAQLYVFKKLAKLLYLFRCTCMLLEHQFPSIAQRSVPPTGTGTSITKQASPGCSNVPMYKQFVYLHRLLGQGERRITLLQAQSLAENFQLCQVSLLTSCH